MSSPSMASLKYSHSYRVDEIKVMYKMGMSLRCSMSLMDLVNGMKS